VFSVYFVLVVQLLYAHTRERGRLIRLIMCVIVNLNIIYLSLTSSWWHLSIIRRIFV